jgi:hypothetical protein
MKIAGSGPFVRGIDPWIRIHIRMSWIRNTALKYDFHGNANEIFFRKAYQHIAAIKSDRLTALLRSKRPFRILLP